MSKPFSIAAHLRRFAPAPSFSFNNADFSVSKVFSMTNSPTSNDKQTQADIDASVAHFLLSDPEFLIRQPQVLAELRLPNIHGDETVSLTARQVSVLREKIAQLEDKLEELIGFGVENDEISQKTHELVLGLIGASDYRASLNCIRISMKENFKIPYMALRLWGLPLTVDSPEFEPIPSELRLAIENMQTPYCGAPTQAQVLDWFEAPKSALRSVALVPLMKGNKTIGLFALGSDDPKRFFSDMGTLYLERMGQMLAAALCRQLS